MKVLSLVVTYNGMQWYKRCFSSLRASSIPVDIFVVDNASSDGTVQYIKTNFPEISIYESNVNLGFGQANNIGLRYALDNNYDFVFLLNQDAWIAHNDAIEQIVKAYKSDKQYAIISPVHLYGSGMRITKEIEGNLVNHNIVNSDIVSDLYFKNKLRDIYQVDYVCAAAWLLPKRTLQDIGGFDPLFFHYGEDDNYMQRVKYHGYKIGVCPYSCVCHDMEFREGDFGMENNTWQKNLLIELADINKPLLLIRKILFYYYTSITKLGIFKVNSMKANFRIACFILQNKSAIESSYKKNIKKNPNWIK